jgi:isoleucyl-tRNA synthetase
MYNFKEIEEEAKKRITKKDIQKAVSNDKTRKKTFSFLEGPPTANAPPALHHLEVRTFKDIVNKFRYMQGFNVPRKAGWDCHGLPVEVQIEKKLKLNSKKDILKYGEAKFIKDCRESVFSYIDAWNKSTEQLGYMIDLDNPYRTLDNDYIESVWWSLKKLYDEGLLYEAHKVVPFCPRCQTPLSSHEVAQGYKTVTEDSVYIKFKVKDKDEYILAWTTTPWTLPGNVALAVGKDIDYVKIQLENGEKLILGKERLSVISEKYKILEEFKGKKLEGVKYQPLFDIPETQNKNSHQVLLADFVTTTDGTGVVHTAVMYGEEDYNLGIKKGLPAVHTVGEDGKFLDNVPKYKGIFVKSAEKDIKEELKENGSLYKIEKNAHEYPYCWRCDTPLLYYAIDSWFIKVTTYKDKLIKLNKKINWTPKHIQEGRFGDWLENVKDWALSRKKFWGTPLPIWECSCGNQEIVGSVEELKKKSIKNISEKEIDLHKPWIDNIKIKCSKCKKEMFRVEDVIDCWYDSGSASFAQFHYPFENKTEFEKRVPYDFISEAIDQTRGWFYTLHVLSTILFGDVAYKNVICAGHIVDEKGEKMSKSKGNILNPEQVLSEVGVDATRLQFCTVDIGGSKRFGIQVVKKEIIPFLNVLWNTSQFYKQINNEKKAEKRIEDKWILSRLNSVIKETTLQLENYQIEKALFPIMDFVINDFSKTYIKIIREREDKNVKEVIGEVLDKISRLLAPYTPNITEIIYKDFGKESVHLAEYPKTEIKKIDKKLETEFSSVLKVIELGLSERDKEKIGLKWPLAKATITSEKISKELQEVICRQLNIKKIELKSGKEISVKLDTKMTEELEAEGYAREISRSIQAERKKLGLVKTDYINLEIKVSSKLLKMLNKQESFLKERVNAKKIIFIEKDILNGIEFEIKEEKIKILLKKI